MIAHSNRAGLGISRGKVLALALIGLVAAALVGPATAGAAIAFRDASVANGNVSTINLAKPTAVVEGDVMLAHITVEGGSGVTITAPTGWTLVVRTNNGSDIANAVYRKVAGSSEAGPYGFGVGSTRNVVGAIVAYSGVDNTTPVNAFSSPGGTGDSTSVQAPGVTTTVANTMIVGFFSIKKRTSFTHAWGTERYDQKQGSSLPTGTAADVPQAAAGASGNKTATADPAIGADKWAAHLVALKPFVNQAPTCQDVTLVTTQDTTGETDPNCSDPESNPLTYSIVAQGTKGTASVVSGKLQYVPNAGATGSDSFTYRANDGTSNSNTSTVNVTIEVSCALLGTTLTIAVPEDGSVTVSRDFDGDIAVTGTTATCAGSPTVLNVDTIAVTGTGGDETLTIDLAGGNFAPGMTNETGDTDEIEWTVDLGSGSDELVINGSAGPDVVRAGATAGINLSNDGDADISVAGIELLTVNGGEGDDNLHGIGAFGNDLGGRWTIPMHLNGDGGVDKLQGGLGNDELKGGLGNDKLTQFNVADGADVIEGGAGKDSLAYTTRTTRVEVVLDGLATDGASGEGDNVASDVEVITGGSGGDLLDGGALALGQTLQGGPGDDDLFGGPGIDSLNGGAGADELFGQFGRDTLNTIDGVEGNDTANGGGDHDVCKRDAGDTATNCEA
jgi:hypothetical protein